MTDLSAAEERTDAYDPARNPHWRRNMVALTVASLSMSTGAGVSFPFLPLMLRELGVAEHLLETWVGWVMGTYFGVSFFLTPIWGVVADHFGRKLMVLRTGLGMGALFLLIPLAGAPWHLIAIFSVLGTTNGFIPATQAMIATNTPPEAMGRALSMQQSGVLVGQTVGPGLGALLGSLLPSYRAMFWVSGSLLLAAGLIGLLFTREVHQRPRVPFRLNLRNDLRQALRIPNIPVLYALQAVFTFTFVGSATVASVYALRIVQAAPGYGSESEDLWVGAVGMALPVASAVAAPLWGRLMDRIGAAPILAMGLALGAVGTVPVVLVASPPQLVAARFLMGSLAIGIGAATVSTVKRLAPTGMESRVLAFGAATAMLGMGGAPLVGGIIGPWLGLRVFFAINAALLLLGCLAWWRGMHRHPLP